MAIHIKTYTFNFAQENTYLVYNEEKEGILIDPGFSSSTEKNELLHFIKQENISIHDILLTHAHIDHIVGLAESCRLWDCVPYLHINEKMLLSYGESSAQHFKLAYEPYVGEFQWMTNHTTTIESVVQPISIIHAPGHSPGSVCYYFPNEKILFGGDVLFLQSIGRTDLPGGNFETLIQSIQNEILTLDRDVKLFPGHGPVTYVGYEKELNPFLV